jgi:hypothetical protein
MDGMGFIENNKTLYMLRELIDTHLLVAAGDLGAGAILIDSKGYGP